LKNEDANTAFVQQSTSFLAFASLIADGRAMGALAALPWMRQLSTFQAVKNGMGTKKTYTLFICSRPSNNVKARAFPASAHDRKASFGHSVRPPFTGTSQFITSC
jgi:hypothetical protein